MRSYRSCDRLELAANGAGGAGGVPDDKIDETVRSLSERLGWDITKGATG